MDRLIRLEPSNLVAIRIEPGQKCYGELTLRNVMYTMPVAIRMLPVNKGRYTVSSSLPGSCPFNHTLACKKKIYMDRLIRLEPSNLVAIRIEPGQKCYGELTLQLQKRAYKDNRNKAGKAAYDVVAEHGHTCLFDALKLGDSLCLAARKGEARTIQRLIKNSAAINGMDQHGWTALHRAAFKGRTDAVRMLIDKGIDIDSKDEDGYTALHCAVESGHAEGVQLLVKKGADVEARTNKGVTALQIADSLQYAGISKILIHDGNGKLGKEIETKAGTMKRRLSKPRALPGSFDRSLLLVVI
ncbi:hypothetical protein GOBAR_AA10586 [Gossypium barbadense]|uniref:Uncharacterized protein n=1 Tax=Gossypium barbadense TaxID=3634 RepID=A0A2P5Y377_GOSBA|nr:hypothetical protein GOBAR_AA10586 [Gossypium barbadense]